MPNTSFKKRFLSIQVTLSKGTFPGGDNSTVITDLAMTAQIEKKGPPDFASAEAVIRGLDPETVKAMTALSMNPLKLHRNYLNIFAGDDPANLSEVFAGTIVSAETDAAGTDRAFKISAEVGFWGRVYARGPENHMGPLSDFVKQQAQLGQLDFVNEGVNLNLPQTTFSGSPVEKARAACEMAGADLVIDDDVMILLPKNGHRKGQISLLNAESGMLGFPSLGGDGIGVRCVYDPSLRFAGLVEIQTNVEGASGQWRIVQLTHKLAANCPDDGSWESEFTAYYPQYSDITGKII